MIRMTLRKMADALQQEGYWLVEGVLGHTIKLAKNCHGKPVTVSVTYINKKFSLAFPSYLFKSRISHFSPTAKEYRYCCNKAVIIQLIHTLKRSRVWNYIDHDFIEVNGTNEKSDKTALDQKLKAILAPIT